MSNESRSNQSSIRYSDKVKAIVNDAPGKTFGDKFENICVNFLDTKESRENYIKSLDKKIKDKEKELNNLSNKIYDVRDVVSDLERLSKSLKKCNTKD